MNKKNPEQWKKIEYSKILLKYHRFTAETSQVRLKAQPSGNGEINKLILLWKCE